MHFYGITQFAYSGNGAGRANLLSANPTGPTKSKSIFARLKELPEPHQFRGEGGRA